MRASLRRAALALGVGAILVSVAGCWGRREPPPAGAPMPPAAGEELWQGGQAYRDQMLADRVFYRLSESISLSVDDIRPSASQGTVTLQGTVATPAQQERAVRIVRRTIGVRDVKDSLQVDPSLARRRVTVSDDLLARNVAMALQRIFPLMQAVQEWSAGWEIVGPAHGYAWDVDADGGIVTLEGNSPSLEDIRKAVEAVRRVPGVHGIRNVLYVRGYAYYSCWPYLGLYPPVHWW